MKLVANIKLLPTADQADALRKTLDRCNEACNWLSALAWEHKAFRQFDLHKIGYHAGRAKFDLAAQVMVRCIAKVADAYKLDKETQRTFRPTAAQPFDDRIFRFASGDTISIWTLTGRVKIGYVCGEHQRMLLANRKGEVDLMFVRGKWYIAVVCDFDDPALIDATDVLGVDFGIVNIATDSDGNNYSGEKIESSRLRYARRRARLQRVATKSAKRRLKRLSGKQSRFQKDTNHVISKAIVQEAERTGRAIALENLKGIGIRVKANGASQRARMHNWGYAQLGSFVAYKSAMLAVLLLYVDPRNTSREYPCCGTIDKRNRPNRDTFRCIGCCHTGPADEVAGRNIRSRGLTLLPSAKVNRRMVAEIRQVA